LRWRQQDGHASIDLTAPLGVGAAHLELTGDALEITNSQGESFEGEAAEEQLRATLGFEPPMRSLTYWLRGASDPALPAQESLDASDRLSHLEQDGWQVDYPDYVRVGQYWLPQHLTVRRGPLRLRLAISNWHL